MPHPSGNSLWGPARPDLPYSVAIYSITPKPQPFLLWWTKRFCCVLAHAAFPPWLQAWGSCDSLPAGTGRPCRCGLEAKPKTKMGPQQGLSQRAPGPRGLPKRTVRTFQGLPGTSHQASRPVQATRRYQRLQAPRSFQQPKEPFRGVRPEPFRAPNKSSGPIWLGNDVKAALSTSSLPRF